MKRLSLATLTNFQPKQQEAINALLNPECKYLLYGGAMAGGKSYVLRWGALVYALWLYRTTKIENIPIGLFSEDYPTLKDRQVSRIEREFPKWLGELRDSAIDGLCFAIAPEYGGGRILLRNLDDPSKYMSTEFAGEFVEELTRNEEQTFFDLRNRLRYPGIDNVKFMGASNPGGIGHGWVRKYFIDKATDDPEQNRFYYVHANVYDNKYVPPGYIKQLESLPPEKRKAYLEGSWDVFAGQFFPEFNRKLHVLDYYQLNKTDILVAGMDWGRSAPFAFELTAITKYKTGGGEPFYRATTFLEVTGTERTPAEWAKEITYHLSIRNLTLKDITWIRGDPSMFTKLADTSISIARQFNENGIMIKPASNDRLGGWENLHHWLTLAPDNLPYWRITQNCRELVRTLPELVHDELRVEDVDSDGPDHWGDAVRYCFKHLKWLDARVGGIGKTAPQQKMLHTAITHDGKQVSIDTDKFATAWGKKFGRRVYYK